LYLTVAREFVYGARVHIFRHVQPRGLSGARRELRGARRVTPNTGANNLRPPANSKLSNNGGARRRPATDLQRAVGHGPALPPANVVRRHLDGVQRLTDLHRIGVKLGDCRKLSAVGAVGAGIWPHVRRSVPQFVRHVGVHVG
jgi:hypothetical protein